MCVLDIFLSTLSLEMFGAKGRKEAFMFLEMKKAERCTENYRPTA